MASPTDQKELISKFAALLGTKGTKKGDVASSLLQADPAAAASRQMLLCLSKDVESHQVICTLPSLDMRKVDEECGSNPLPRVGEHRQTEVAPVGQSSVPQMDASVLSNAADASAKAAQVEQKAAQTLGSLTSWTRSSVVYASGAIASNISESFASLVDSRVRAWTLLLLRHSLTTGDSASRSRLLSMLSSIIKVKSAQTAFKTLPLPDSASGQRKEADIILPLLLEVDMQVSIQAKTDTVTLRAPGTISGNFEGSNSKLPPLHPGLIKVDIRLDTGAMLDSMVQQARMVVFKAVAKATSTTESLPLEDMSDTQKTTGLSVPSSSTLSGFSSALNLSSGQPDRVHQPAHRLQKARSSALKLNKVLHGGTAKNTGNSALDKSRKSRSVQWDRRVEPPKMKTPGIPSPKRQRVAATTARLRSFKSFGRPHAGDFGSGPRNATFGDFGRNPVWGRDGKLANHPMPMQPSDDQSNDIHSPISRTSGNAKFDFQRPPIHLSSGLDLPGRTKTRSKMSRVPSSLPRTATALEGWLIEKTGGSSM